MVLGETQTLSLLYFMMTLDSLSLGLAQGLGRGGEWMEKYSPKPRDRFTIKRKLLGPLLAQTPLHFT